MLISFGGTVHKKFRAALTAALTLLTCTIMPVPAAHAAVPELKWTACNDGFECAKADVPLDYRNPSAGTIQLAVTRKPATDQAHRIGALFVNPGGPGGSAIRFARSVVAKGPAQLHERFDIVGFDPRGVGESTPATCQTASEFTAALASTPSHHGSFRTAQTLGRQLVDACVEASGALLPYIGTEANARDMDLLRQALGEQKLNYFGISFGTYIGTVYANLFPKNFRVLGLDGAYDPETYANRPYEYDRGQFLAVDSALKRFFTWCDTAACPFGGGHTERAYLDLQKSLDANPVRAADGRIITNGTGLTLQLISSLNGGHRVWNQLADALLEARAHRTGKLIYDNEQDDADFYAQNIAVECADRAFPRSSVVSRANLALESALAPIAGPAIAYATPSYDHGHATACTQWRSPQKSRYPGPFNAPGSAPILVVGTTGDPDTPFQDAVALARTLDNGHLLVSHTEGHSGWGNSACAKAAMTTYLVDGTLPPHGFSCNDDKPPLPPSGVAR